MKVEGQAEIKLFSIDYVEKATVRLLSIHFDNKSIQKNHLTEQFWRLID